MSQADLATVIGCSVRSVKAYEAGAFAPQFVRLRQLARALKFPEDFFGRGDIGGLAQAVPSFRSGSKLSARRRDLALGSAAVAIAFSQEIERLYALPEPDVPNLADRAGPEQAAEALRRKWHLDEGPNTSIVQLLESKGVRVHSLPADAVEADAFSLWHRDRPFLLLNTSKQAGELRLDAAHELAHLVLHRHKTPIGRKAQQVAAEFAAAFLMPATFLRTRTSIGTSDEAVTSLATTCGVPLAATALRLSKLELLSEWHCRRFRGNHVEQTATADRPTEGAIEKQTQRQARRYQPNREHQNLARDASSRRDTQ